MKWFVIMVTWSSADVMQLNSESRITRGFRGLRDWIFLITWWHLLDSSLYFLMSWSSESNCLSLSFRSSFFSCFKFLFLSFFNFLLCSLFWFDSLSAFSFFCFRDSSCFIRDDDWVLLNSLIPTVSLAVSLQAFVILFQVVSGILFSCIFTSNLVWRSLLYF